MTRTFKKLLAFLLALVLCVSMIPMAAFAEETENYDGGEVVAASSGKGRALGTQEVGRLRVLYYTMGSGSHTETTTMGALGGLPAYSIITGDGRTMKAAYCLNHDLGATNGYSYTWVDAENSGQSDIIGTIIALGFQYIGQPTGNPPTPWGKGDSNDKWLCTQLLVWAACNEYIRLESDHLIFIDPAVDADMAIVAPKTSNPTGFLNYYEELKEKLLNFRKIPSFASYPAEKDLSATAANTITLEWDGEQYSATVTDQNNVLSNYNFRNALPDVEVSMSGNTLTLTSAGEIKEPLCSDTVTYRPQGGRNAVACWTPTNGDPSQQNYAVYTDGYDPVNAVITVKTGERPTGNIFIAKTSEDGVVSGISFQIEGNGIEKTVTTGSDGTAKVEGLVPGEYTVTELEQEQYAHQPPQTVTVFEGKTGTVSFTNVLKKWNVTVTKTDRKTGGQAQGDATMIGAVYGIYYNGVLQDQYSTDSNGKFTSKWYPCGTGWSLREIAPCKGYLLNTGAEQIGLLPEETSIEYNATSKGVREQVIRGKISIVKHTGDGSTQIEAPEAGAEFQIYLSASGSYAKAKEAERDTITIDEAGYGETKLLPYGKYTVHQTKGWAGAEKMPDFQVFISEDSKTYPFIINNRTFEALVQIVKKDSETGRVIPASGIGFKIKDVASGKWVSQHINYPTPMDISIFYTDVTGRLMLPSPLTYGKYELYEQQSAYGYVLSKDPVPFTVDGTAKEIAVEMGNTPQMGQVTLRKSGEVFSSVTERDGVYQPVYEKTGLSGAVYSMYAEDNISTLDGTLRYAKGQLIQQVETNAEGKATFPAVFLGKYKVVETRAPIGYVRDNTEYHVELSYAGQEVSLVTEKLELSDQRQNVRIDLAKRMEQDDTFKLGTNGEIEKVRFSLYAAEKLTARDGRTIPADGLIETVKIGADGTAVFASDLPFGSYYIRETATDDHYILNTEKYPVTFSYTGQQTALVKIRANDGQKIKNRLKRGAVSGRKVGENEDSLAGALFGLFPADSQEFTAETAYMQARSGEDGVFSFENVPCGKYLVKELEALSGYVLLAEPIPVEITEDGQTVELGNFVNEHTKLRISKQDMTTGKELPGAKLELRDKDGKVMESWTSTDKPHLIERLPAGEYVLHEETAPNGYLVSEDVKFTVLETGEIQKVVMKDAPKPIAPNTGEDRTIVYVSGAFVLALIEAYVSAILLRRERKKKNQ